MKIIILCHNVRKGGGVPVCVELIKVILAASKKKEDVEIRVTASEEIGSYLCQLGGLKLDILQDGSFLKRLIFDFQIFIRSFFCAPHVVFGLGNITMPVRSRKRLILVHNPYYLISWSEIQRLRPPIREASKVIFQRGIFLLDCMASQCIFVQSTDARQKFLDQKSLSTMGQKIKVLPNFRSDFKFVVSSASERQLNAAQGIRLLCLAAYYPHKNLEWLVEVVSEANNTPDFPKISLSFTFEIDCSRALQLQNRINKIPNIQNLGKINIYDKKFKFFRDWDAFISASRLESWSGIMNDAVGLQAPIIVPDDWFFGPLGETAYKFSPNDKCSFFESVKMLRSDIAKKKVKLPEFSDRYKGSIEGMLDEIFK